MNHAHPTIIRPLLRLQGQPLNLPCHYTAAALVALVALSPLASALAPILLP